MTDQGDRPRTTLPGSDLDEMEIIGNRAFTVAVPVDADAEFKAYILAAGATYSIGNRSIDNVLRKNWDRWVKYFEEQDISNRSGLTGLRRIVVREAISRCIKLSELNIGENSAPGKAAAARVLIRLESSFRSASQLIQLGYPFESEAVIRLGFEQVAWAYAVRDMTNIADVEATSGTGNITMLKAVFPGAGRIYSRLSDLAHVSPRTHERFVLEVDGGTEVRIKAPLAAKESISLLLVLLDAFLVVGELTFSYARIGCVNINAVTASPMAGRTVDVLIKRFESVLPPGTSRLFASWWT